MITEWTDYKYGCYRLIDNEIECYASQRTLPYGFIPIENAHVVDVTSMTTNINIRTYFIRVKVATKKVKIYGVN